MQESRSNYQKTDIKLRLINELRARSMTKNDIKFFLSDECKRLGRVPRTCKNPDNYKVCDRTVNRMLIFIGNLYGKQLEKNEEFGTYRLDLRDFPDTIDDNEIQALDVALKKIRNDVNTRKLLEELKSKLTTRLYRKIKNMEPKKAERKINDIDLKINSNYANVGPRLIANFDDSVKSMLDIAISKQQKVRFLYNDKNEYTVVCPLGILYGPNNVYLVAYEYKNNQISNIPRHYILSEISDLYNTQEWFPRNDGFSIEKYANSMFGVYNDGKVRNIEWLIKDPKIVKVAKKYIFHSTQRFIDNPDGSLTVKMHTGGLYEISSFLATWDGKIIPTKPKELIKTYRNLLQNCLDSISNK